MKYIKILFFIALLPFTSSAQYLEGGVFLGTSSYYGDLDPDNLNTEGLNFGYGIVAKYNLNDYVAIRASLLGGQLTGDDALNDDERIRDRNLDFRSPIAEFAIIPEFNILGYNPYDRIFSPYVFAGIAFFRFNPQTDYEGQTYQLQPLRTEGQGLPNRPTPYSLTEFAIPLGAGVKFSLTESWNVSFEMAYRFTFTDYIDDVSSTYVDRDELIAAYGETSANLANRTSELYPNVDPVNAAGTSRGNATQNDRYLFTGFTMTYNFLNGFGSRGYGCPNNF